MDSDDTYSRKETEQRADKVLRHMISRLPEPHATHPPSRPARSRKKAGGGRRRPVKGVSRRGKS